MMEVFEWQCIHCNSNAFSLNSDYTIECKGCGQVSPLTDAYPELQVVLGSKHYPVNLQ